MMPIFSREKTDTPESSLVSDLFSKGAHIGYTKTRRHPSTKPFIFGKKNTLDIIDLSETEKMLLSAEQFVEDFAKKGKKMLFVGTKPSAAESVYAAAESVGMPYVTRRWIGGTFTNFDGIKKRLARLDEIEEKERSGGLSIYTKKEQSRIVKERETLEKNFGGIRGLTELPGAIFVVDSLHEKTAVTEARSSAMPVVSLSSSDCDLGNVTYPILANDTAKDSIAYITKRIADAYARGKV